MNFYGFYFMDSRTEHQVETKNKYRIYISGSIVLCVLYTTLLITYRIKHSSFSLAFILYFIKFQLICPIIFSCPYPAIYFCFNRQKKSQSSMMRCVIRAPLITIVFWIYSATEGIDLR